MKAAKISILGAGKVAVGTAEALINQIPSGLTLVICNPTTPEKAEAYADRIQFSEYLFGRNTSIRGTGDINEISGSRIVILTLGQARQPGQSRNDLFETNTAIVYHFSKLISEKAPKAILINASNPLDQETYIAQIAGNYDNNQVMGVAGALDTGRFRANLSTATHRAPSQIRSLVLGTHGNDMIPILSHTTVGPDRENITDLLSEKQLERISKRTSQVGGFLNRTIGGTSLAVGAAITTMVKSILYDERQVIPCSVAAVSGYGIPSFMVGGSQPRYPFLGLPVRLGKNGIEEILSINLSETEMAHLHESAKNLSIALQKLHDEKGQLLIKYRTYTPSPQGIWR